MGRLTTHVLDTAHGLPGAGIRIELFALDGERRSVTTIVTNDDGRGDGPLLDGSAFQLGVWELVFDVGPYFERMGVVTATPPFLDQVSLRFGMSEDTHYHVPLLVSPWSYSTYRGS
jgi:5-hydroxyisourate hydrolase